MDRVLRLLGIAYKAGRAAVGEEPVAAAARARSARVILLAADAAGNSTRRAQHVAQAGHIPVSAIPFTKAELGRAVGRSSCAMLAVTDAGLALAVAQRLAAVRPDSYGPLTALLEAPAQRALDRQREQRRHERNLSRKKAPWAPPPPEAQAPPRPARTGRSGAGAKKGPKAGAPHRGGRNQRKKTP